MSDWRKFSDSDLVSDTKQCVAREREATLAVLERLREIRRRLIHLEIGYSSLHEFCVAELGYSDGAAYRRIHAMELCEEIPKAREAIASGKLSITNAASLQTYLEKAPERHDTTEKKEALLAQIEGKSRRECERIFYPEQTGRRIEFVADEPLLSDLKRLSELLAISESDPASLIKKIAAIALRSVDPCLKKKPPNRKAATVEAQKEIPQGDPAGRLCGDTKAASPEKLVQLRSDRAWRNPRYIPSLIKQAVWRRDDSQCSFMNVATGRRCSSRYGLQIDHVVPLALGGRTTLENLRLLCFAHNHFEAQRLLGREAVAKYNSAFALT